MATSFERHVTLGMPGLTLKEKSEPRPVMVRVVCINHLMLLFVSYAHVSLLQQGSFSIITEADCEQRNQVQTEDTNQTVSKLCR